MSGYCTLKPHFPGIPNSEPLLKQVWKLSGILERDSCVYFGATEYGMLVREITEEADVPRNTYPKSLKFGVSPCLHAINSGSDDKVFVALLNQNTPGAVDFKPKADKLITGRAPE